MSGQKDINLYRSIRVLKNAEDDQTILGQWQ